MLQFFLISYDFVDLTMFDLSDEAVWVLKVIKSLFSFDRNGRLSLDENKMHSAPSTVAAHYTVLKIRTLFDSLKLTPPSEWMMRVSRGSSDEKKLSAASLLIEAAIGYIGVKLIQFNLV